MINWKFSPSYIEQYYAKEKCKRGLFVASTKKSERTNLGLNPDTIRPSYVAKAGDEWEKEVVQIIKNKGIELKAKIVDGNYSDFNEEETKALYEELVSDAKSERKSTRYFYQTMLSANESFVQKYMPYLLDEYKEKYDGKFVRESGKNYYKDESICIEFSNSKPDLIKAFFSESEKKYIIRVVDVKLAERQKLEHKMQVALYVLMLSEKLKEWGIDEEYVRLDMDLASLWNRDQIEEKSFELENPFVFLKEFLLEDLKNVYDEIHENEATEVFPKLQYTIGQRCEWCESYSYCKKWCVENEPLALAPYLTPNAQNYIKDLKAIQPDVMLIDGFKTFVTSEENRERLNQSMYWKRFIEEIKVNNTTCSPVDMLAKVIDVEKNLSNTDDLKGVIGQRKAYAIELPNYEDVALFLTAQKDEGSARNYAYGIKISVTKKHADILKLSNFDRIADMVSDDISFVTSYIIKNGVDIEEDKYFYNGEIQIIAKDKNAFDLLDKTFIELLYEYLLSINNHNSEIIIQNRELPNYEKKPLCSLQTYVLENHEILDIQKMLFKQFDKPHIGFDLQMKICELLFLIQGQSLVESEIDFRPETVMSFPVIVLSNVANKLYSLPSTLANNYYALILGFNPDGFHVGLEHGPKGTSRFLNRISNTFRNDVINKYWKDKKEEDLLSLSKWIKSVLNSEAIILSSIRNNHAYIQEIKSTAPVYAKSYVLQLRQDNNGVVVSNMFEKLLFEAKYEAILQKLGIASARIVDADKAVDEGKAMHLKPESITLESGYRSTVYKVRFEVLNRDKIFREDQFTLVFTEYKPKNLNILRATGDPQYFSPFEDCRIYPKKREKDVLFVASTSDIEYLGEKMYLNAEFVVSGAYNAEDNFHIIEEDKEYLAYEYYKDYNIEKNIDSYKSTVTEAGNNTKSLTTTLMDVSNYYAPTGESFNANEQELLTMGMIGGYTFSNSQKNALKQLFEKNITLLLGPPGTGKTDFISRSILVLSKWYRKNKGKNIRVLVCANSHSAIENVLFAVTEKAKLCNCTEVRLSNSLGLCVENTIDEDSILVTKLERFDDGTSPDYYYQSREKIRPNRKGVIAINKVKSKGIDYNDLEGLFAKNAEEDYEINCPVIVGSTCWSLQKIGTAVKKFDLVIIDEASQVRLVDALIPLSFGHEDARYLIVGDENQLSPIVMGNYDKNISKPFIYGSVFRYLYDCSSLNMNSFGVEYAEENKLDYTPMLSENYRMNDILVEYAANVIYGDEYKAPNSSIGEQKLSYSVPVKDYLDSTNLSSSKKEVIEQILDPEYPLVLCVVNHDNISEILPNEREWIKIITRTLENTIAVNQSNPVNGEIYTNQTKFWGDSSLEGAFGIIAPHHEHIMKLKDMLSEETDDDDLSSPWGTEERNKLYIGTVDKLQGKQRQAVIVSYGVSNIENALNEGEFIYSRNRLNVSLTRGKKKTIVFLTEALLEYPIEALAYDDIELLEGIQYVTGFKKYMEEKTCNVYDDVENGGTITVYKAKLD